MSLGNEILPGSKKIIIFPQSIGPVSEKITRIYPFLQLTAKVIKIIFNYFSILNVYSRLNWPWPVGVTAQQGKKTHTNRKNTSKFTKHLYYFGDTWSANTRNTNKHKNASHSRPSPLVIFVNGFLQS